jgi:predicted DCC family thiol-disulfide oxidoreductase YuxK
MYDFGDAFRLIWRTARNNETDQYLIVFAIALAFFWIAGRYRPAIADRYLRAEQSIASFLQRRELFYVADSVREEIWINFLRVVVGYMFFNRSYHIFYYQVVIADDPRFTLISLLDVIASFGMMIGFLTPIAIGYLFLFHTYVHDILLDTFTLGSCVAQILMMLFLFIPSGRRLSLDSLIMRTQSIGSAFLRGLYAFFGEPTVNRIATVKFFAFISYGLLCMYSVYEHFLDPYWMNGTANVLLLSSNWLTAPYKLFRELFTTYGSTAIFISMVTLYIMMLWELVIIPFTLIKGITRYFVIAWGLAFFVVSIAILQLSWLPHYQFALFALFFWPGWLLNRGGARSLELYYDDRCNLCDRTVRIIKLVDWFEVVQLRPMSRNAELIASRGLTSEQVFDDLHGHDPATGRTFAGYDLYIQLAARILILAPLWPILLLGRWLRVGPMIYAYIAKRRRKIFGVCELPTVNLAAAHARESLAPVISKKSTLMIAFAATYAIFLAVYLIKFPYFSHIPGWSYVQRSLRFVGSVPPALNGQIALRVFTPNVIKMGSHYFTITGVFADNDERMLPYVGPEGDRLPLVLGSDRLYFGHSLRWRRMMYDRYDERICYDQARDDKFIFSLFRVAEGYWGKQPKAYRISYYHQPIPDPEAATKFQYKLAPIEKVCTVTLRPQQPWVLEKDASTPAPPASSTR